MRASSGPSGEPGAFCEEVIEGWGEGHEETDGDGSSGDIEIHAIESGGEECRKDQEDAASAAAEGLGAGEGEDEDGGEEDVAVEGCVFEEGEEFAGDGADDGDSGREADVGDGGGPNRDEADGQRVCSQEEGDAAKAQDVAVGEVQAAEEDAREGDCADAAGDCADDEGFDGGEFGGEGRVEEALKIPAHGAGDGGGGRSDFRGLLEEPFREMIERVKGGLLWARHLDGVIAGEFDGGGPSIEGGFTMIADVSHKEAVVREDGIVFS